MENRCIIVSGGVAGNGIFVLYQHMASVTAAPYTEYAAGETVGASGTSGMCTGPHWHIESYVGTAKMDSEYSMGYQLTMELLKEDRNFTAIAGQNDSDSTNGGTHFCQ